MRNRFLIHSVILAAFLFVTSHAQDRRPSSSPPAENRDRVASPRAPESVDRPTMGVLEAKLVGKGYDPDLRQVFTSLVRGKVLKLVQDRVDVIEGSKLEKMIQTNSAECSSADCLAKFTRQVGLEYLLETRLLYRKGAWTATLKLASARSENLLAEETEDYESEQAAKKGLPLLAEQVVKSLTKSVTPTATVPSANAVDDQPVAPPPPGASKLIVSFTSTPSGSAVTVDGRAQGVTPCKKTLLQGEHLVEMAHDNYRVEKRKVELLTNGQEVSFPLTPLQTRLSLEAADANSGDAILADVYVDGVKVGATPFDGLVPLSLHKIEVEADGYKRTEVTVVLEEGKAAQAMVRLDIGGTVRIPAGCFLMGSPKNESGHHKDEMQHNVCLSAFRIDRTEVTQGAYRKATGKSSSRFSNCGNDCPVDSVSWDDAKSYCKSQGKRLPTEAEWEYAARAGSTTRYYWGDSDTDAVKYAWYGLNSDKTLHPVAKKLPNKWGIYDMSGNVWEWVNDWYGELYPTKRQKNPSGPSSGSDHGSRGGGWSYDFPSYLRSANRTGGWPDGRPFAQGFRCVGP